MRDFFSRLLASLKGLFARLFLNPDDARFYIAVFVTLLLLSFASQCSGSELWFEVGSTVTRAEAPVVGFAVEWPRTGPKDSDWLLGLHLIGSSEEVGGRNQAALSAMLVDGLGRLDIGLGVCLLHHSDALTATTSNFNLSLAWRFNDRWRLRARHCSSAGLASPNKGRDALVLARRF